MEELLVIINFIVREIRRVLLQGFLHSNHKIKAHKLLTYQTGKIEDADRKKLSENDWAKIHSLRA